MAQHPEPVSQPVSQPVFHPFDLNVPEASACLDRLYDIYAYIPVNYGWCRQCFTLEEEQKMRAQRSPKTAPLSAFSGIYFEHPNCSGGESTFLHWLPRGLETAFFNQDIDPMLIDQAMRLGLWHRPAEEQAALRALFTRVAINWCVHANTQPLILPDAIASLPYASLSVSRPIVNALLSLRVDPSALFAWLIEQNNERAWIVLMDLLQSNRIVDDAVYYALNNNALKPLMEEAVDALDRLARHALHALLPAERLIEYWLAWQESAPALAAEIADAESMVGTYAFSQSAEANLADEGLIRVALDTPNTLSA